MLIFKLENGTSANELLHRAMPPIVLLALT